MALTQGKWFKFSKNGTSPGARSSHVAAVVGHKVYVLGGESSFTIPVDDNLYAFDLRTHTWSVVDVAGDKPPSRVGCAMAVVGETIYMFGGRIATAKEPNDGEFYAYNTATNTWTLLSSGDSSPPFRTYNAITADDRYVYVFGGVGAEKRLKDLWAYDTVERTWTQCPNPGDDCVIRGGPGLASVKSKIWVVYGFTGEELGDIHCYDPANRTWTRVETSGEKPSPRSVFATAVVDKFIIIYGGETKNIGMGHKEAGIFSDEVHALDTETLVWTKLEDGRGAEGRDGPLGWCPFASEFWKSNPLLGVFHHGHVTETLPGARGWCAFATGTWRGKAGLVVHGGNSPSNERLEDIFFFAPQLE